MPVDSDREEGEIVDDYDFIISSDEDEENVRQRIQELEDKNYELEQIAQISAVYSNDYNNISTKAYRPSTNYDSYDLKRSRKNLCYNVPSNVSSISSEEYSPIPVRRRKRGHTKSHYHKSWKENKRKERRHREENYHNHSNYYNSQPTNYDSECEQRLKNLREKINEELQNISQDHVNDVSLNRDLLRTAIARDVNLEHRTRAKSKSKSLKERSKHKNTFLPICIASSTTAEQSNITEDHGSQKNNTEDSMSMDEQELRLIALKSAVINKHMARKKRDAELAYSPTDFNDYLNNDEVFSSDEGNVELDMTDLTVGMDISPALSPISSSDVEIMETTVNTRPVDMDIAMSDSDEAEVVCSPVQLNNIDRHDDNSTDMNYIEMQNITDMIKEVLPLPPPPPPPLPSNLHPIIACTTEIATNTAVENCIEPIIIPHDELTDNDGLTDDEEEERALRALLLAKIQFNKKMEKNKIMQENNNNINKKREQTPTESILKQAVARLRMKSQSPTAGSAANVQQVATTKDIPKTIRPPLKIRSVSTINSDYVKIQESMVNKDEDIIADNGLSPIVNDKCTDSTYNANALRDISCNDNIQNHKILATITTATTTTLTTTNTSMTFTNNCDSAILASAPVIPMLKENTTTTNIPNNIEELQNKNVNINNVIEPQKTNPTVDNSSSKEPQIKLATPIKSQKGTNQAKSNKLINFALDLKRKSLATLKAVNAKRAKVKKAPPRLICTRSVTNAKAVAEQKKATTTTPSSAALYTTPNYSVNKTPTTTPKIQSNNSSPSSRLITIMPKVQVPNLIITLAADSSEESDENFIGIGSSIVNEDYMQYDNASPISLPMDSPVGAPSSRSDSPVTVVNKDNTSSILNNNALVTKTVVNDCFQQRLDEFLKDVRTKNVPIKITTTSTVVSTTTTTKTATTEIPNNKTTTTSSKSSPKKIIIDTLTKTSSKAVRHLPESSQREYRLLLQRMTMLEKIKLQKSTSNQAAMPNNNTKITSNEATTKGPTTEEAENNITTFVSANNRTLIRKVLVKNANNTAATAIATKPNDKYTFNTNSEIMPKTATSTQDNDGVNGESSKKNDSKLIVLQAYEKSYEKNGIVIISKINHSLEKLKEAREAKIQKLRYNKIINDLKAQLRSAQIKYTQAHAVMNKVFPSISSSIQLIATLKGRRTKLRTAATEMGTQLNGECYRLKNDDQAVIIAKSEELASGIEEINKISSKNINVVSSDKNRSRRTTITTCDNSTMTDDIGMPEIKTTTATSTTNLASKDQQQLDEIAQELPLTTSTTAAVTITVLEVLPSNIQENETIPNEKEKSLEDQLDDMERFTLTSYVSPLNYGHDFSGATKRDIMAIICPFGLLGECRDNCCKYVHL